jgi:nitrous oxidase accessory protein NosD
VLNSSSYQFQTSGITVSSSKNIVLADDASSAGGCSPHEGCGGDGIDVVSSNDVVVSGNYLPWTQGDALHIAYSTNVTVTGNRIGSSGLYEGSALHGVHMSGSSNVTLSRNNFSGTGLFIEGLGVTPNTYTIRPDNTVNGKPLYYYNGCKSRVTLDQVPVGQVIIVNCSNVRLTNLKITNTDVGITMIGVKHALVENVNASSNHYQGISLASSSDVTIKNVDISNMAINFFDLGAQDGLLITGSKGIIIDSSRFVCCEFFALRVSSSVKVTISRNTFSSVSGMLCLSGSTQVRIFHNNFFQETAYLCLSDTEPGHFWDNGYPRGGNYWSNYPGVDNCSGPQQNHCKRADGIGDTPYPIPGGVYKDNYPLMKPFNSASIPSLPNSSTRQLALL